MLLDGDRIVPEPADHAALFEVIQGKLVAAGLSLRDAIIIPVTPAGALVLAGCLALPGNEVLAGNTWMLGTKTAPVTASTKHVVFLDGKVAPGDDAARNGKRWLVTFAKQLKLSKRMKGLSFHLVCFFTSTDHGDVGDDIKLVAAMKAPTIDPIDFFKPEGTSMSLDEAMTRFGWERDFTVKERHELVLDKLKSELWG